MELRQKLDRREFGSEEISLLLDDLAHSGLQNDARFCESYVRQRASRGFSPRRISADLNARGISRELANEAIHSPDYNWPELALLARIRKFKQAPATPGERAKQTRFLEYRGFEFPHIRHALERAEEHEDY